MRVSKKTEYAVHSILYIANLKNRCVLLDELAAQGISREYLAKVMRMLTKSGILKSSVGVNGGYLLARPADEITLKDILLAVEGENFYKCEADTRSCVLGSDCIITAALFEAKEKFLSELEKYKIGEILEKHGDKMAWLNAARA